MIIILGIIIFVLFCLCIYIYKSSSSKIKSLEKEIKLLKENECDVFIKDNNKLRERIENLTGEITDKSDILLNENDKLLTLVTSMHNVFS